MVAALDDDAHVREQRARLRARRRRWLRDALVGAGFRIDHSEASLYLWATRDEDCWDTVAALADLGVLVAPGAFYGPPAPVTSGSRSPPPTSGSAPPSTASPRCPDYPRRAIAEGPRHYPGSGPPPL